MPNQEQRKIDSQINRTIKRIAEQISFQPVIRKGVIVVGLIAIVLVMSIFGFFNYYFYQKLAEFETIIPSPPLGEDISKETPKIRTPKVLYNLAGSVEALKKDSLILRAIIPQLSDDGRLIQKTEIRQAMISPKTKFSRLTFVVQEESGNQMPNETKITFEELRVGDYVEVISDRDISREKEFESVKVRILPR